ncbi:MAG TPA: 30S ribosomal protein S6 [Thermoleophilaceae bacterium]|jgi:small subunit ribosomal protein S6
MPLYDLMLMLDSNAPDERRAEIASNVQAAIEGGGTLVGAHDWGMRRIAYEIDHRQDAEYRLYQFETPDGNHELLEQLDHTLKITDGVLRFRIIRLKPGSPAPPAPRQAGRPRELVADAEETATVAPRSVADAPRAEDEEVPAE